MNADRKEPGWSAPVTRRLVHHLSVSPGDQIVEIAAGSGVVGFDIASTAPPGALLLTDIDAEELAAARQRFDQTTPPAPQADHIGFVAADMLRLPFADSEFDAAVCRWGFMFARDTNAVLVETHRVLRPGGRLAFAVWGHAEENPWQSLLDQVLGRYAIEDPAETTKPGGMFALADDKALHERLERAGFDVLALERVRVLRQYRNFDDYWRTEVDDGETRPPKLRAMTPRDADSFRRELKTSLASYEAHGRYAIPGVSLVVAAERSDQGVIGPPRSG